MANHTRRERRSEAAQPRSISLWGHDLHGDAFRGVLIWVVLLTVITVLVALNPMHRTLMPLYHEAAANWLAGTPLYHGPLGMNYLPQFPILFTPFHWLGVPVGDILWRIVSGACLVSALWQLARLLDPTRTGRLFLWITVLAVAACASSLRSGQGNAIFAAASVQAVVFLIGRRWWPAAGFLAAAVAIKPLGLVMLCLAPVVYRPVAWRLGVALPVMLLLPFCFGQPDYVLDQYRALGANLFGCAQVTDHRFANLHGLFRSMNVVMPSAVSTSLGLAAAGGTLIVWLLGGRRSTEPERGLLLLTLSAGYLMLFNPMTETNSYVILAPAIAVFAVYDLHVAGRRSTGWLFAFLVLSLGLFPEAMRRIDPTFGLWWHPIMTMIFVGTVVGGVFSREDQSDSVCVAFDPDALPRRRSA